MKPTEEQASVVDECKKGGNLKVIAFAGCGKTATLKLAAPQMKGKGLYLAFNRANALEAKAKFKGYADASTVHALAYKGLGNRFKDRLEGTDGVGKLSAYRLASLYNYAPLGPVTSIARATIVRMCLDSWMNSAAERPQPEHVNIDHAILAAEAAGKPFNKKQLLIEVILKDVQTLINDLLTDASLPMPFDFFLKIWVMSKPVLPYDYIFFDEAQDANELFCHLILSQPMQKVLVGDPFQSIYGFRGAVNVLQDLDYKACHLTQSFRFGQLIADHANTILKPLGATVPVKGFEMDRSTLGNRQATLFRSNMGIFGALLKEVLKERKRVAVVGGTKEMAQILQAVEGLQAGEASTHPDFAGFSSWREYTEASRVPGAPPEMVKLVDMCENTPPRALRIALEITDKVKEEGADMVMSTAHKSKGREWPYVSLMRDFYLPETAGDEPLDEEESRLNYVAMTRAQVDITGVSEMLEVYRSLGEIEDRSQDSELEALVQRLPAMGKSEQASVLNGLGEHQRHRLLAILEGS